MDLAYSAFAWIAVVVWIEPIAALLPIEHSTGQVLLMLTTVPIVMGTLGAGLVAVILSFIERRERPLLAMSATIATMFFFLLAVDWWSIGEDRVLAQLTWYGGSVLLAFFCVRWFAFARRRATSARATSELIP